MQWLIMDANIDASTMLPKKVIGVNVMQDTLFVQMERHAKVCMQFSM